MGLVGGHIERSLSYRTTVPQIKPVTHAMILTDHNKSYLHLNANLASFQGRGGYCDVMDEEGLGDTGPIFIDGKWIHLRTSHTISYVFQPSALRHVFSSKDEDMKMSPNKA